MRIPKTLHFLLYITGLIAFQEIALRICFPIPEIENFNRINYQILASSNNKPSYIRNVKMLWKSSLDTDADYIYDLNTYGYRDKNWDLEKDKNKKRIMFVGDSFVEGMMADVDETIPSGFVEAANKEGDKIEAMNFGMMGIGLNEYIKLIVDAVPLFKPDYVFLVMFSNDVPFNRPYFPTHKINPRFADNFTPRIIELIKYSKRKDPIPFRWGFDTQRFYKPTPDKSNPWTFHADSLIKHVKPEVARAMRKGDFNFFRTNWVLEEEKFLKAPTDLTEKLRMLNDYIVSNGSKMMVYYIPSRNQVSTYYYQYEKECCIKRCPDKLDLTQSQYLIHGKMLSSNCAGLRIPYFNMTDFIVQKEKNGNHLYWNYDDHMKGSSYLLLGEQMYHWWKTVQN